MPIMPRIISIVATSFALALPLGAQESSPSREADGGSSPSNLALQADSLFAQGRFDEAIPLYERFGGFKPDRRTAGWLYQSYLAIGLFDQAVALLLAQRDGGAAAPWPGWWHCRLALTAIFRGDSAALALQTDSLLPLAQAGNPGALECAAFNEVFLRRYSEAKSHLELYVTDATPNETPLNLGFVMLHLGDADGADSILSRGETSARTGIAEDSTSTDSYFALAEISAMRGDVSDAVRHLAAAMERGLGSEWWVSQLFSHEALTDPVFEPIHGHPEFRRLRAAVMGERDMMRARIRLLHLTR